MRTALTGFGSAQRSGRHAMLPAHHQALRLAAGRVAATTPAARSGAPRRPPTSQQAASRRCCAHVTCLGGSGGGGGKGAAVRGAAKKPPACGGAGSAPAHGAAGSPAAPVVAAAAAATTATVAAADAGAAAAPPPAVARISNPSLGFSNNIVPAGPLVVTPPPPLQEQPPVVDSSDEELDESPGVPQQGHAGTGRTSAYRCLVLDSRYLPVNVVTWFRAVCMDASGKADVLAYHAGGYAYSAYAAHPLPAVLRVHTFVDVHEFAGRLSLTRKNIMLRDHHTCQYCGAGKDLTLDHVTPVCRGGVNSWTNLVTACMACNQRKGDKTLAALGWRLPRPPREPTPHEVGVIAGISKNDLEHPPLPWAPYLATFKQVLEKARRRAAAAAATAGPGGQAGSSGSSSGPLDAATFAAQQQELLGVKGRKAAAAAAAAAAGGGVKAAGGGKARQRGASSNAKRMRH